VGLRRVGAGNAGCGGARGGNCVFKADDDEDKDVGWGGNLAVGNSVEGGFENTVDDAANGGRGAEGGEPNKSIASSTELVEDFADDDVPDDVDDEKDDKDEDDGGNDDGPVFEANSAGVDENVGREFGIRNALLLLLLGIMDFCSSSIAPTDESRSLG
jgi:hypothetical protein